MRRWLCLLLFVIGCDGASAGPDPATTASVSSVPAKGRSVRVEVAVIRPSVANLAMSLPGEVEASRDADLAAALGGYVEKVSVKEGDEVKKGAVLARVDTATHVARQSQAKVELDTAKREHERAKKLGGALPRAQLEAAESRVDAAKAAWNSANVAVSRSVVSAPFAGVIAKVNAEVGEVAPPGAPLIRVVQLDPIKVTVSLSDRDVSSVREGMAVSVSTDARKKLIEGKVAHVHPAADMNTRSFLADIVLENKDRSLLPGMIATVNVSADMAAEQIVLSQDWLVTKPDQIGVFVNVEDVARWRTVKAGPVVRDRVVILDGVKDGDELIIAGHRDLSDGDSVLVARRGTCCREGRVYYESEP